MKSKVYITLYLLGIVLSINGQNSFPTSGNVGIGNTSPASLLTIGSASVRGTLDVKGSSTDIPAISISDLRTGGGQYSFYNGLSSLGSLDIFDQSNSAFRFTIRTNGNIGIGTAYPDALLHVKSNNVIFGSNGGSFTQHIHQGGTGGKYHVALDGQTRFTLDNDGRLGLGPVTPLDKLHLYTGPSAAYGTSGGITISDSYTVARLWDSYGGADVGTLDLFHNDAQKVKLIANGTSYLNGGNVGIGTANPVSKLNISDGAFMYPAGTGEMLQIKRGSYNGSDEGQVKITLANNSNGFAISYGGTTDRLRIIDGGYIEVMSFLNGGNVGIGIISPSEKLSVNGNVRAKKVIVSQTGWPDYVFDSSYALQPLEQVGKFIQQHKRLPEMPSAKEIEEKGLSIGDSQTLLLKKMEEMTLYLLEMQKEIKELKRKNTELENKIKER